ncbi:MAG: DUF6477 family protein [Pseudomonadota bacterium]
MTDLQTLLRTLDRPRLLVKAARHGKATYRRDKHLTRLLDTPFLPGHGQASMQLICIEQEFDAARRSRAADYSPARHINVLAALMAEAEAFLVQKAQENASATSDFLRVV